MRSPPTSFRPGPPPTGRWARFFHGLREAMWGLVAYEFWHELRAQRMRYEDALNIFLVGQLLGIPLMNSTVTLRLLPYLLPDLKKWKERQLAEFEVLDHPPDIT